MLTGDGKRRGVRQRSEARFETSPEVVARAAVELSQVRIPRRSTLPHRGFPAVSAPGVRAMAVSLPKLPRAILPGGYASRRRLAAVTSAEPGPYPAACELRPVSRTFAAGSPDLLPRARASW